MKPKKYLTQLKNSNKETGKRRICDNTRIFTKWISIGEENDANSPSHWGEKFNSFGIGA